MNKFALSMMAIAAISFSACSDDDDDDKKENDEKIVTEVNTEFVDLGLSVDWATCNLGAKTPEGDGAFFAWGQISPSNKFDWAGYKYCSNVAEMTMSKYNEKDGKTTLDLADDAAYASMKGNWRMPTYEECTELTDKCTAEWVEQNGVQGYKFTSTINGNSIFIPAAGYAEDDGTIAFNSRDKGDAAKGCYWSSTLHPDDNTKAMDLFFYKADGYVHGEYDQYFRFAAQPIRPVRTK